MVEKDSHSELWLSPRKLYAGLKPGEAFATLTHTGIPSIFLKKVLRSPEKMTALEVGPHLVPTALDLPFRRTVLLDISDSSLPALRETLTHKHPGRKISYVAGDVLKMPFKGKFDVGIMNGVLGHLPADKHEIAVNNLLSRVKHAFISDRTLVQQEGHVPVDLEGISRKLKVAGFSVFLSKPIATTNEGKKPNTLELVPEWVGKKKALKSGVETYRFMFVSRQKGYRNAAKPAIKKPNPRRS
ncbi:MAG: class I SAM-dependent methyltransferase [Candidatus Micrarchaeota archaeon]